MAWTRRLQQTNRVRVPSRYPRRASRKYFPINLFRRNIVGVQRVLLPKVEPPVGDNRKGPRGILAARNREPGAFAVTFRRGLGKGRDSTLAQQVEQPSAAITCPLPTARSFQATSPVSKFMHVRMRLE